MVGSDHGVHHVQHGFSMGRYGGAQQHSSHCSTIDADRAAFTIEAWMWKEEVEMYPMV